MAKGKIKAKNSASVGQGNSSGEMRTATLQVRDLQKSFNSEMSAMKTEFKRKSKNISAMAYAKAYADVQKELTKRDSEKAKLLRETGNHFDKNFKSKFAVQTTVKSNPTKKARKSKKSAETK